MRSEPKQIKEVEGDCQKYIARIGSLEIKIVELNAKIHKLETQLVDQRSIKRQLKQLYMSLDTKVLNALDKRGHARKPHRKKILYSLSSVNISQYDDVSFLLHEARKTDIAAYFRYRTRLSAKKLHYRIMDRAYRTSRNLLLKTAKTSFRIVRKAGG